LNLKKELNNLNLTVKDFRKNPENKDFWKAIIS
jgi:hypothetical protein